MNLAWPGVSPAQAWLGQARARHGHGPARACPAQARPGPGPKMPARRDFVDLFVLFDVSFANWGVVEVPGVTKYISVPISFASKNPDVTKLIFGSRL